MQRIYIKDVEININSNNFTSSDGEMSMLLLSQNESLLFDSTIFFLQFWCTNTIFDDCRFLDIFRCSLKMFIEIYTYNICSYKRSKYAVIVRYSFQHPLFWPFYNSYFYFFINFLKFFCMFSGRNFTSHK